MKKIGILGGTFDPVHTEHINIAVNAIKELGLDELLVVPTFLPPHKNTVPTKAEHRLDMLKLAFKDIKNVVISDYEIKKQGKSYSFETVLHFKEIYKQDTLYFLVGGDMLNDFKTWRNPQIILDNAKLAVFGRENYYTDVAAEREYFKKVFDKDFILLGYTGKPVSATKIRIYASLGFSLDGMVAAQVEEYIKSKSVYAPDRIAAFVKEVLPEKRLLHTANVAVAALSKVKELSLDYGKVYAAAMLHDCAKYMDAKSFPEFKLPGAVPQPVVHQFLGAYVAETVVGIKDEEVLDAIRYHTSGKANMTTLGKLIFVADMIEEGRSYDGVEKLRKVFERGLNSGFKKCLEEEYKHLINKGGDIYSETENAYNYYVKEGKF